MFDGTDLSLAYGAVYEPMAPVSAPPVQQVNVPTQPEIPKATASHAQPPEVPYSPPPAMYTQQPGPVAKKVTAPAKVEESFWEKIAQKKWDVIKMFTLSLVVLIAISIDRMATHYLTAYVGKAFLTEMQEFLVRLSYPVTVLVVLWILKALA